MTDSARETWLLHGRRLVLLVGAWTAVMLAVAGNCVLYGNVSPQGAVPFSAALRYAAGDWLTWIFLTPVTWGAASRARSSLTSWSARGAMLAAVGLVVVLLKLAVETGFDAWSTGQAWGAVIDGRLRSLMTWDFPVHGAVYLGLVVAWFAWASARDARRRELESARLQTRLARAELRTLKAQLQPHFVLNALNTVAAMIRSEPERAEDMIVRLGELLQRLLADKDSDWVSLDDELEILGKYLDIERVRFEDHLQVELQVAPEVGQEKVPSLLLQPFVENSIKHRRVDGGATTHIRVKIERRDGRLLFEVRDDGPWTGASEPRPGIGLETTVARLDGLYGRDYDLEFSAAQPSGMVVRLDLPCRRENVVL